MTTIERLQRERADLLTRVGEIEKLIAEFNIWEQRVESMIPTTSSPYAPSVETSGISTNPTRAPKQGHNQGSPMSMFERAVSDIFDQAESPMNRSALLGALLAVGIDVGGADPKNTLSARMSRMSEYVNIAGHGYWARHRDYLPAGYAYDRTGLDGLQITL